jgi:RNA-binding protein
MPLTGKDRAALRAEAHHLTPLVHVGQYGLSPTVIQSLDDALRTHELVKVQLGRNADVAAKDAAAELAAATDATVIQGHRKNRNALPGEPGVAAETRRSAAVADVGHPEPSGEGSRSSGPRALYRDDGDPSLRSG